MDQQLIQARIDLVNAQIAKAAADLAVLTAQNALQAITLQTELASLQVSLKLQPLPPTPAPVQA